MGAVERALGLEAGDLGSSPPSATKSLCNHCVNTFAKSGSQSLRLGKGKYIYCTERRSQLETLGSIRYLLRTYDVGTEATAMRKHILPLRASFLGVKEALVAVHLQPQCCH